MSNPSEKIERIRNFLNQLSQAQSWGLSVQMERDLGDWYALSLPSKLPDESGPITLRLSLRFSPDGKTLALGSMYFDVGMNQSRMLLSPEDFLAYHGRKFLPNVDSRDKKWPPLSELWQFSAPKDLDALFREYDKLAARLHLPTLFS